MRRAGKAARLAAVVLVLSAPAVPAVAADARVLCTISDDRITESSGLAAAGDRLYTINDGGDDLRVYVLDRSCRVRDVIRSGTDPFDVEDLARTADGTFWLGDTGDNDAQRDTVAVERLRPDGSTTVFRFSYPDGPRDAEAILVDRQQRIYIVTKEVLTCAVYTVDGTPTAGRTTPLRKVAGLSFAPTGTPGGPVGTAGQTAVTGAAISPDGKRIVVRTYTDAYLWDVPDGDVEAAFTSGSRTRIALPETGQGEAVTFSPDGRSVLTSTEGSPAPVHLVPIPAAGPTATATSGPSGSGGGAAASSDSDDAPTDRSLLGTVLAGGAALLLAGWAFTKLRPRR